MEGAANIPMTVKKHQGKERFGGPKISYWGMAKDVKRN